MDPQTLFIILAGAMAVSGGLLGGFWVRALINMRKQVVENSRKVQQLAETVTNLRHQLESGNRHDRELTE